MSLNWIVLLAPTTAALPLSTFQTIQSRPRRSLADGTSACKKCKKSKGQECVGRTVQDESCEACSRGQKYWPCNLEKECWCWDTALPRDPGDDDAKDRACSGCGRDSETEVCVSNQNSLIPVDNSECAKCLEGQSFWPCDDPDLCWCWDTTKPKKPPAPASGLSTAAALDPAAPGPCDVLTRSVFDVLAPDATFPYTYEGLCAAIDDYNAHHAEKFAAMGTAEHVQAEIAAFWGNTAHESDDFEAAREYLACGDRKEVDGKVYCKPCNNDVYDWKNNVCTISMVAQNSPYNSYCQPAFEPPEGCVCETITQVAEDGPLKGYVEASKVFYGRGAIQLSWNYNYIRASYSLTGSAETFCRDPEQVASTPEYAWGSSIFFWMENQKEGTTCHKEVLKGDFGGTLNNINGGLECPAYKGGWHADAIKLRLNRYCHAASELGLPALLPMDGCKGMTESYEECLLDGHCPYCEQYAGTGVHTFASSGIGENYEPDTNDRPTTEDEQDEPPTTMPTPVLDLSPPTTMPTPVLDSSPPTNAPVLANEPLPPSMSPTLMPITGSPTPLPSEASKSLSPVTLTPTTSQPSISPMTSPTQAPTSNPISTNVPLQTYTPTHGPTKPPLQEEESPSQPSAIQFDVTDTYFCGTDRFHASSSCHKRCRSGTRDDCKNGETCFGYTTCEEEVEPTKELLPTKQPTFLPNSITNTNSDRPSPSPRAIPKPFPSSVQTSNDAYQPTTPSMQQQVQRQLYCASSMSELKASCESAESCALHGCSKGTFCFPFSCTKREELHLVTTDNTNVAKEPTQTTVSTSSPSGIMPKPFPSSASKTNWPMTQQQLQQQTTGNADVATEPPQTTISASSPPGVMPKPVPSSTPKTNRPMAQQQVQQQPTNVGHADASRHENPAPLNNQPAGADYGNCAASRDLCKEGYTGWEVRHGCKEYYWCTQGCTNVLYDCGIGLLFDKSLKVCNFAHLVQCGPSTPAPAQSSTLKPSRSGGDDRQQSNTVAPSAFLNQSAIPPWLRNTVMERNSAVGNVVQYWLLLIMGSYFVLLG